MSAKFLSLLLCGLLWLTASCTSKAPARQDQVADPDPANTELADKDTPALATEAVAPQTTPFAQRASSPGLATPKTSAPPSAIAQGVSLVKIHRGLSKPVGMEYFEGDALRRLFVVQQPGTIRAIQDSKVAKEPLLDIRSKVSTTHSEQGLLGLAFHPKFTDNRRFYVNYTDREGATRVVEYRAGAGEPLRAEQTSAVLLLKIAQPWRNHNGGALEFGPDGMLYVGMGDGGAANDPNLAGQDPKNQLGKMLRIDVESKTVSTVQSGLRNPWRYTFDRKTGDLYIADVGQNLWEEIDVVAAQDIEGVNWGWSDWEGNHCFRKKNCKGKGMAPPAVEFDHRTGCSVTGGIVYRGKAFPALDGAYFYSDFCTAILRSFRWEAGVVSDHWDWKTALDPRFRLAEVSSFAEDADGEMYLLSLSGSIYKLSPTTP